MKRLFAIALVCFSLTVMAQPNNPGNPVPLDGGLSLLLAGGAALGYRVYKETRKN